MLVKLLPEQVADRWDAMSEQVAKSLPPVADSALIEQIYYSLLMETSQMWVLQDEGEVEKGFIITTTFLDISDVKTFLIYEAVVLDAKGKVAWTKEYETLRTFARSKGCTKIAAFVANRKVVDWLKNLGADTRFSYIYMDI